MFAKGVSKNFQVLMVSALYTTLCPLWGPLWGQCSQDSLADVKHGKHSEWCTCHKNSEAKS